MASSQPTKTSSLPNSEESQVVSLKEHEFIVLVQKVSQHFMAKERENEKFTYYKYIIFWDGNSWMDWWQPPGIICLLHLNPPCWFWKYKHRKYICLSRRKEKATDGTSKRVFHFLLLQSLGIGGCQRDQSSPQFLGSTPFFSISCLFICCVVLALQQYTKRFHAIISPHLRLHCPFYLQSIVSSVNEASSAGQMQWIQSHQ